MTKYVVPMYESERGWKSGIDGYAGPFDTLGEAQAFMSAYNKKNNNFDGLIAPEWYIAAQPPVEFNGQECAYLTTL